jgi:hypothetical protein
VHPLFICDPIDSDSSDADLFAIPELGLFRFRPPQATDTPLRFLNVPSQIADFFIEVLAVDQPEETRHRAPKRFRRPILMGVRLPDPIPMQFSSPDPDRTRIGFFDSDLEPAVSLEHRVSRALNVISHRRMLVAQFLNVDALAAPDCARLANAHRVPVLRVDCDCDATTETVTFVLRILQTRWGTREAIESAIREAFAAAEVLFCSKCDLLYCAGDRCHGCRRLPFDACCGRIPRDSPPEHSRQPDRAFSKLVIGETAVYGV